MEVETQMERIGQFEFTVQTCEPDGEQMAREVDALTRWLLAEWDREQAERREERSLPEPSMN